MPPGNQADLAGERATHLWSAAWLIARLVYEVSDWTDAEGSFFVAQGGSGMAAAAVKPLNAMGNLPSRLNVIRSIHTYAQILSQGY